jgi:hypothetical protein
MRQVLRTLSRPLFLESIAVTALVLTALVLRLYKIHEPLADWHSFRQADTASVTREFVKRGIDILHPHYHDMSNIQSGKDNLEGWRMVEFPLANAVIAHVLLRQPSWNEVVVGRAFSIGASLISLISLWFVVRAVMGRAMAVVTAGIFAVMPYSVFYSRTILPEPYLVMFLMLTLASLVFWARSKKALTSLSDGWLIVANITWSLALLMKPMALFYSPLFLAVVWRWRRFSWSDLVKLASLFLLGLVPLWWWRDWIKQFPTGIPVSDWLFNSNNIRLRPAWWRWLFADRLGRLMLGQWGTAFFALGAMGSLLSLRVSAKKSWPLRKKVPAILASFERLMVQEGLVILGLVGMMAYLIIIATGNVQHDYYQVMLVPIISLVVARGIIWIIRQSKDVWQSFAIISTLLVIGALSWYFAFYEIKGFYQINNPALISAGEAVQRLTPPEAVIIAPYMGDTSFMYQTSRRGWPLGFEIDDKIAKGAQYYITTSQDDEANMLMRQYTVMEKTPEYILIDLQRPLPATQSAKKK